MAGKGVGVTVASGESAGDAADLPTELEVVQEGAEVVAVGEDDVEDADGEAYPEHAPGQTQAGAAAFHPCNDAVDAVGHYCG